MENSQSSVSDGNADKGVSNALLDLQISVGRCRGYVSHLHLGSCMSVFPRISRIGRMSLMKVQSSTLNVSCVAHFGQKERSPMVSELVVAQWYKGMCCARIPCDARKVASGFRGKELVSVPQSVAKWLKNQPSAPKYLFLVPVS